MRGLLYKSAINRLWSRITPACAGTTCRLWIHDFGYWDHPRVCGDYTLRPLYPHQAMGSPPRVRGLRKDYDVSGLVERMGSPPRVRGLLVASNPKHTPPGITPACAGTTSPARAPRPGARDHPRVCGDYILCFLRLYQFEEHCSIEWSCKY